MFEKLTIAFLLKRSLVEQRKQREALDRIATSLEELLLRQGGGTGLRTYYKGTEEGGIIQQSDEDFALLEAMEARRKEQGGREVEFDEDLE